jgi:hypothetical protein
MNFVSYEAEYGADSELPGPENHLRFELGWSDVSKGLGLILRGYFVIIFTILVVSAGIMVLVMMSAQDRAKIPWQVREAGFFLGLVAVALIGLYSYGCIVIGHWRCLMNAPERCGAKWLMFACLTCILAGPALNVAAGVTGVRQQPKFQRGIQGISDIQYSSEGAILQVGSIGIQVLGNVLFLLFLRAIARCFEDRGRVLLVDLYLGLMAVLIATTIGLVFIASNPNLLFKFAVLLGVGWVGSFLAYLAIIFIIRAGISTGLSRLASPLDPLS